MRWLITLFVLVPGAARASCQLALALGLDVSGSVDAEEYRLQQDGLVAALEDPNVQLAMLARSDGPVALLVYEWSASTYQRIIVDWTLVETRADLAIVTGRIAQNKRPEAPYPTSIGSALLFAARQFERVPDCARRTIDLSGDGKSNDWPPPDRVLGTAELAGVTVNALVIGSNAPLGGANRKTEIEELMGYFESEVIAGARAFAEPAIGYEDYAPAMTRKLLRELAGPVLGGLLHRSPQASAKGG